MTKHLDPHTALQEVQALEAEIRKLQKLQKALRARAGIITSKEELWAALETGEPPSGYRVMDGARTWWPARERAEALAAAGRLIVKDERGCMTAPWAYRDHATGWLVVNYPKKWKPAGEGP